MMDFDTLADQLSSLSHGGDDSADATAFQLAPCKPRTPDELARDQQDYFDSLDDLSLMYAYARRYHIAPSTVSTELARMSLFVSVSKALGVIAHDAGARSIISLADRFRCHMRAKFERIGVEYRNMFHTREKVDLSINDITDDAHNGMEHTAVLLQLWKFLDVDKAVIIEDRVANTSVVIPPNADSLGLTMAVKIERLPDGFRPATDDALSVSLHEHQQRAIIEALRGRSSTSIGHLTSTTLMSLATSIGALQKYKSKADIVKALDRLACG